MITTFSPELTDDINKRITMNMLIQGVATHSCLSAHYLVKDELEDMWPNAMRRYDSLAIGFELQYWKMSTRMFFGSPSSFWKGIHKDKHPFHKHPLLRKHGAELNNDCHKYLKRLANEKKIFRWPFTYLVKINWDFLKIMIYESSYEKELEELAKEVTVKIWDIPDERLDAELTTNVSFGRLRKSKAWREKMLRKMVMGYSAVERDDGQLIVRAKAVTFTLLCHELIKGVGELVCLPGLNHYQKERYEAIVEYCDQLEFEHWLMVTGSQLWRQLLPLLPQEQTLAVSLMKISKLSPDQLNDLCMLIIEEPKKAKWFLTEI